MCILQRLRLRHWKAAALFWYSTQRENFLNMENALLGAADCVCVYQQLFVCKWDKKFVQKIDPGRVGVLL